MNGTVKWFNLAKGFGVITLDEDPEKEVFCHVTNIEEGRTYTGFNIGDSVEFEAHEGRKDSSHPFFVFFFISSTILDRRSVLTDR